mmetsp:Transcript_12710/g.40593  ORF Transcript_12710/g.40593 Transcript_12710/m.40593 type:complete len:100 (-) Transcript_12710:353-652(-)
MTKGAQGKNGGRCEEIASWNSRKSEALLRTYGTEAEPGVTPMATTSSPQLFDVHSAEEPASAFYLVVDAMAKGFGTSALLRDCLGRIALAGELDQQLPV